MGIALGAIVSPTDAVATSIVKQTSISRRAISILDGESLLNDATALVLLRTAIFTAGASFSFWGALGDFAKAVAIAVVIGWLVGWANVWVRARVPSAAVNTALSFTIPFVAAVPTEQLGGSGLVAAVVAGLFTGIVGPRKLPPGHRLSDAQNWQTIELVLEGAVFLTMGLELAKILQEVQEDHRGIGRRSSSPSAHSCSPCSSVPRTSCRSCSPCPRARSVANGCRSASPRCTPATAAR